MNPVVRGIIGGAPKYSAVDAFEAEYRLRDLRRATEREWGRMDVLVLPTTGTIYTHEAIAGDPVRLNTNLGYYTNFVNLLDLAAVAAPGGFRPTGCRSAFRLSVRRLAMRRCWRWRTVFIGRTPMSRGPRSIWEHVRRDASLWRWWARILSGSRLNWQLTERRRAPAENAEDRAGLPVLCAAGTQPPKPGLVREEGSQGPGIEVEIWAVPENEFGSFVAAVPPPLGIGSAALEDGETVKCFICEPYGLRDAREITQFGGWREFLASQSLPASV